MPPLFVSAFVVSAAAEGSACAGLLPRYSRAVFVPPGCCPGGRRRRAARLLPRCFRTVFAPPGCCGTFVCLPPGCREIFVCSPSRRRRVAAEPLFACRRDIAADCIGPLPRHCRAEDSSRRAVSLLSGRYPSVKHQLSPRLAAGSKRNPSQSKVFSSSGSRSRPQSSRRVISPRHIFV